MIKKFCFSIISFFVLFGTASAAELKVENIFSDIDSNYLYLEQLQELYNKGMVSPDNEGKFSPNSPLRRDEFVGILSEINCEKCIKPNTAVSILTQYETANPFFDIARENKYFYCVASATDKNYVRGYQPGTACIDGNQREGEAPFCPNNIITLEESIAVILRASGILTQAESDEIISQIYNGEITRAIASDVAPKNEDGGVNSFYPALRKALQYEVPVVSANGEEKIYKLIELEEGKLFPKKTITKEDFLKIAYVAIKARSCRDVEENNLAIQMDILDKICEAGDESCEKTLNDEDNIFDFDADVEGICEAGIDIPNGYIWRYYHEQTGEIIKKYGPYIDNHDFLKNGLWKIFLRVIDRCGNTGEVYNTLVIQGEDLSEIEPTDGTDLKVSIDATPISGVGPLLVDFTSFVTGGEGPYQYIWNFDTGDGDVQQNPKYIFVDDGTYNVQLTVTDSEGNIVTASVLIQVTGQLCTTDTDNDGVNDCIDKCPLHAGSDTNLGCPIFELSCSGDEKSCPSGYSCQLNSASKEVCLPQKLQTSCLYNGGNTLFGNVSCTTCPCQSSLDFRATLRKCDIIFPAITSVDATKILSKGNNYQIK